MSETVRDADLDAEIERGRTLPAEYYTDTEIHELEKKHIFSRFWQYVGPKDKLSRPGDFLTYRAGNIPIVVVCDDDGDLRGFVNVCRHRGTEVVPEPSGNRRSLQCLYHGWTYGLDGRLRAAPRANEQADFRTEDYALPNVQVDTWGPFVFVNPDLDAVPLREQLGELPDVIEASGIDFDTVRYTSRIDYDLASNWKVVVENFSECYHCPIAHPGLSDLLDIDAYRVVEYEYFQTHVAPLRQAAKTGEASGDWDASWDVRKGHVKDGSFNWLWPNFMVVIYPGPSALSTNLIVPVGVDRTLAVYEFFFSEEVTDEERAEITGYIDLIQREDIPLCESVQRGMKSGFFDQGTLMLTRENGIRHFQRLVHKCVTAPE